MKPAFVALLCIILTADAMPQERPGKPRATVTNPVAPVGHDPWVIQKDGWYHYCCFRAGVIAVHKARKLQDAVQFAGREVWRPEAGKPWSRDLWAPELHFLRDRWYTYVAADDGRNESHRMYVLEGAAADSQGNWTVYHAARKRDAGWDRNVRIQRFTWDVAGNPVFGEPVPENIAMPAPGEKQAP